VKIKYGVYLFIFTIILYKYFSVGYISEGIAAVCSEGQYIFDERACESLGLILHREIDMKSGRVSIVLPIKFLTKSDYDYTPGSYEPIPDIESERNKYELLSWDMEPGDCIVFHFKTLHSGRGNPNDSLRRRAFSSRWIGDDAVFAERPGETSPPFPELSSFKQNDPLHHSIFPVCWKKQLNL